MSYLFHNHVVICANGVLVWEATCHHNLLQRGIYTVDRRKVDEVSTWVFEAVYERELVALTRSNVPESYRGTVQRSP